MLRFPGWLVMLVVAFQTHPVFGQEPERIDERAAEIIDECVAAMGGELQLSATSAYRMQMTLKHLGSAPTAPNGQDTWVYDTHVQDGKVRTSLGNDALVYMYDGQYFWMTHNGNSHLDSGNIDFRYENQLPLPHVVVTWQDFPGRVRFVGDADVRGTDSWHLEFHCENGFKIHRYFDKETGLVIRQMGEQLEGQKVNQQLVMPNFFVYQEIDGVQFVASQTTYQNDQEYSRYTYEFDINARVDEDLFAMPESIQKAIAAAEHARDESEPGKK